MVLAAASASSPPAVAISRKFERALSFLLSSETAVPQNYSCNGRKQARVNLLDPFLHLTTPHQHHATRPPERPLAAVGGVATRGAAVRTERVVVGTALRLPCVVLVDARGADDGETTLVLQ